MSNEQELISPILLLILKQINQFECEASNATSSRNLLPLVPKPHEGSSKSSKQTSRSGLDS